MFIRTDHFRPQPWLTQGAKQAVSLGKITPLHYPADFSGIAVDFNSVHNFPIALVTMSLSTSSISRIQVWEKKLCDWVDMPPGTLNVEQPERFQQLAPTSPPPPTVWKHKSGFVRSSNLNHGACLMI